MAVEYYNTVPAEHQPLVAEAPKKKTGGRVVAAAVAAAFILATAVAGSTTFRAASNLAKSSGKTTQLKLDTSNAGQWAPKQPMCISVEDRGKTVPATYYDFDLRETVWQICESGTGVVDKRGVLSCDPAEDTRSGKPSYTLKQSTVPRKSFLLSGPTTGPNHTKSSAMSDALAGAWKPSFSTHSLARAA